MFICAGVEVRRPSTSLGQDVFGHGHRWSVLVIDDGRNRDARSWLLREDGFGPPTRGQCSTEFGFDGDEMARAGICPAVVKGRDAAGNSGRALAGRLGPSLIPALAMLIVGRYRASEPSLGWDENATLIVSRRTLGQIFDLVRHTDASIAAVSFLTSPVWVPRYVLFILAPLALVAALAVHRSAVRSAVVLGLVLAMAWPAQMEVRGPATHHGPSFREIAGIISRHQRPGDGIVYGGPSNWSLRAGVDYYLAGEQAPRDLLLVRSAAEVGELGAQECKEVAACVADAERVWLVRLFQYEDPLNAAGPIAPVLLARYRTVRVWRIAKGMVALYERK